MIISMRYSYSLSFFLTNFLAAGSCGYPSAAKPSFSRCTTCMVINLLNRPSTGIKDMQSTAAVVMDQRLGVIKGEMTSSYEITLETFKVPSPHVAVPSLLVTLRSPSAYSFQGVNYLPRLIWRYSTR